MLKKTNLAIFAALAVLMLLAAGCSSQNNDGSSAQMPAKDGENPPSAGGNENTGADQPQMTDTSNAKVQEAQPTPSEEAKPSDSAVAGEPAAAPAVKELVIEAFDFGFTKNDVEIRKGDTVRLTLTVSSGFHGIGIPEFGVSTGTVNAGESKTVEFVADKAGSFPFYCNVYCGSGHKSMRGTLVVAE